MNETWWVGAGQLDPDQRAALVSPPETEMLIIGPPGSGKTNVLMLRANYVKSVGPRIAFLTFTRSLAEFLRTSPNIGRADQIARRDITTFMAWARQILRENGVEPAEDTGDFDVDRRAVADALSSTISNRGLGKLFDTVFVDEVQDFLEVELEAVRTLTHRMCAAGDDRQRIWQHRQGLPTAQRLIGRTFNLQAHYRVGRRICELADQILPARAGEASLLENCNYDEEARQSSVTVHAHCTINEQIRKSIDRIKLQQRYIVDEPIGVLCVTNEHRDEVWNSLSADSELSDISICQRQSEYVALGDDSVIRVMTVHAAKGSEFRAVHLIGSEKYTANRRELAFTAVTRAKTEVDIYSDRPVQGFLTPPRRALPSIDDVF